MRLSGEWIGSVTLERSTDSGATWFGLTTGDGSLKGSWSGNINAPVAEETVDGARYLLPFAVSSGMIGYEVRQ